MGKLGYRADYYFNNEGRLGGMFGDAACPVDLNAGLVVEKQGKYGMDSTCGSDTQDNIRDRFGLQAPDIAEKDGDYDE